jgi:DNA-binding beta-propeller fold protein YncE
MPARTSAILCLCLLCAACEPPQVAPERNESTIPQDPPATEQPPPPDPVRRAAALPHPAAPASRAGSAMAVTAKHVLVADAHDERLVVIDRDTLETRWLSLPGAPEQVVAGPAGFAYVSLYRAGAVAKVDLGSLTEIARVEVGAGAWGLAFDERSGRLYVSATFEGAVLAIATETMEATSAVTGWNQPRALAVGDGFVVVTQKGQLAARVGVDASGNLKEVLDWLPLRASTPQAQAVVEARGIATADTTATPGLALAALIHPTTARPLIAHQLAYTGTVQSAAAAPPSDFYYSNEGTVGFHSGVSHASTGSSDTAGAPPAPQTGLEQPLLLPRSMAHHPQTHLLAVAGFASDTVQFFDTGNDDPHDVPLGTLQVGAGPKSVAFSPEGTSLYVFNELGGSVYRYPVAALTAGAQQQRLLGHRPDQTLIIGDGGRWQRARRAFASAATGRQRWACVNCHFDGLADGLTWIGLNGVRQTPVLSGRLAGTAPYNWKGTELTLEGNIDRTLANLGGVMAPEDVAIVASWLRQLPGPPVPAHSAAGDTEAGRLLFEDPTVGCAVCHAGDMLTDGAAHDVGSLGSDEYTLEATLFDRGLRTDADFGRLDTPSLVGLGHSAPYMHDGSAATLEDVLDGPMSPERALSSGEHGDLLAYLRTL